MNELIKSCSKEEEIKFFATPIELDLGYEVFVEINLLDKDKNILKTINPKGVKVEKNLDKNKYGDSEDIIIYKFVVNELAKDINSKDVKFVSGWIDANNDTKISVLYNEYSILKVLDCYCYRDFTVDEVKEIIKGLRDSEKNSTIDYRLLTKDTDIPEIDKTYERFTEELNKTLKKYEINTCLRKIHFLAQAYTESNGFRSSKEEDNTSKTYLKSKPYYPYFGRGFLQLTWEGANSGEIGYKQYFEYLEIKDYKKNFNLINSRLDLAFDVSGYFWTRGKLLTKGNSLKSKYPNSKNEYKNYSKTSITYPNKYTTINLNEVADDDNISQLTYLINGIGMYHLNERTKYVNELKKVFNYEKCRNKK